jgi:hypothetical protein
MTYAPNPIVILVDFWAGPPGRIKPVRSDRDLQIGKPSRQPSWLPRPIPRCSVVECELIERLKQQAKRHLREQIEAMLGVRRDGLDASADGDAARDCRANLIVAVGH